MGYMLNKIHKKKKKKRKCIVCKSEHVERAHAHKIKCFYQTQPDESNSSETVVQASNEEPVEFRAHV